MAKTLAEIEVIVDQHEDVDIPARVDDHASNVSRIESLEADRQNLTADHTSPNPGYIATPQDGDPSNIQRIMTNQFNIASNKSDISDLEGDISTVNSSLSGMTTSLNSMGADISDLSDDFDDLSAEFAAVPVSTVAEISISETADTKNIGSSSTEYIWNDTFSNGFYVIFFKVGSDIQYCMAHIYIGGATGTGIYVNKDYPPKYRDASGNILGNVLVYAANNSLRMVTTARYTDDIHILKMLKY
jgi:archaellum component FlaC